MICRNHLLKYEYPFLAIAHRCTIEGPGFKDIVDFEQWTFTCIRYSKVSGFTVLHT